VVEFASGVPGGVSGSLCFRFLDMSRFSVSDSRDIFGALEWSVYIRSGIRVVRREAVTPDEM
jgi:hypothetical protein